MPACHGLTKVAGTKQDQASAVDAGGLCRARASCGTCHDHVAAQPSSRPTASPVTLIFAPLVSILGEVSSTYSDLLYLRLEPQSSGAGGGNQTLYLPGPRVFLSCLTPVQKLLIILNYLVVL